MTSFLVRTDLAFEEPHSPEDERLREVLEEQRALSEYPLWALEWLDRQFLIRAPELGVRLVSPATSNNGPVALVNTDSAPEWLRAPLAGAFPIGYVLRVVGRCDLIAIDASYRLGGWNAMCTYLGPAHPEDAQVVLSNRPAEVHHVTPYHYGDFEEDD